ncbi:MAG: DNA helicase RecG, partial [Cyanobacteriota bacterium]
MGEGHQPPPDSAGRQRLTSDPLHWINTLQQALQLEADRGFQDLQGRRETFSAFLSRECQERLSAVPPQEQAPLRQFREAFERYPGLDQTQRQEQVRRCRQWLQQFRQRQRPPLPEAPPRLRFSRNDRPGSAPQSVQRDAIRADTPLGEIRGIGPKTASKLLALSLFTAGDLLRYYPRDYLDYANLVRIEGLRSGMTATVVATILRVNAFNSPRNPNLSILELQLQDRSGRLRVSRFLAGKRFATPAYLNSQKRLYPLGATVAVSGLVKDSPYGPSFTDPLIEVLESPKAPVQSRAIGRLLPVYGLTEGLGADRMRTMIESVLPLADQLPDPLSESLRHHTGHCSLAEALKGIHQPQSRQELQQARQRLVFDELLLLQLSLQQRREQHRRQPAPVLTLPQGEPGLVQALLKLLPFPLTGAQQRVLAEIRHDLEQPQPMA